MTERRRADLERATVPPVPIGLQRVLRRAAGDPAFRERLVSTRAAAASDAGIALNGHERAMLDAVSVEQLRTMIAAVPLRPAPSMTRRRATAAAVVLLGGAAMTDCRSSEERSTSGTPDTAAVVAEASGSGPEADGVRSSPTPDVPPQADAPGEDAAEEEAAPSEIVPVEVADAAAEELDEPGDGDGQVADADEADSSRQDGEATPARVSSRLTVEFGGIGVDTPPERVAQLPATASVRMAASPLPGTAATMSVTAFRTAMNRKIGAVRSCYAAALATDPTLGGELVFRVAVHRGGGARVGVETGSPALASAGVTACVLDRLRTLNFSASPPTGDDFQALVTFTMAPGGDETETPAP